MTTASERIVAAAHRNIAKLKKIGYGKYVALSTVVLCLTAEVEFFKALWPLARATLPDIPLYMFMMVAVNVAVMVLYNLAMYFVYTRKIPFFEQYRASKDTPWPWEANPQEWPSMFWKSIRVSMVNIFVVGPALYLFDCSMDFQFKMDLESVPSVWTMVWQMGLFLVVQELMFYWVHRFLHHPRLYWIHKQHHEYNVTASLAPQYAHPLEHILANSIPVGIAYKFLSKVYPVHIFTILVWITLRMIETCDGHSGYDWPWGQSQLLPFSTEGSYHYFHHQKNVGNYGAVLNIFDTVFDTNKDYYKMIQSKGQNKGD